MNSEVKNLYFKKNKDKSEKEIILERVYNKILKNRIYPMVGSGVTDSGELDEAGKALFGNSFKGCFGSDKIPNLKNKESAIINVDKTGEPGSHWCALYHYKNKDYLYDSFGRPNIIKGKFIKPEGDCEQNPRDEDCGARCLAYIYLCKEVGPEQLNIL